MAAKSMLSDFFFKSSAVNFDDQTVSDRAFSGWKYQEHAFHPSTATPPTPVSRVVGSAPTWRTTSSPTCVHGSQLTAEFASAALVSGDAVPEVDEEHPVPTTNTTAAASTAVAALRITDASR
jgi:hypothetical protein